MSSTRSEQERLMAQAKLELELFGGNATLAIEEGPFAWEAVNNQPPTLLKTQSLFGKVAPRIADRLASDLRKSR